MNKNRVFFMVSVILLGAVVIAAPTADTVEDDAEAGWGVTAGNTTYLDFAFAADSYTYSRNGLTMVRGGAHDWGDIDTVFEPDPSNVGDFVDDYGLDDKPWSPASDFPVTITGLTPNTVYGIALSVKGYASNPSRCDYEWGVESQGEPVFLVTGVSSQDDAVPLSGSGVDLYAVPVCTTTSDGSGSITMWFGKGLWTFDEATRTQMDGVLVGTEIPAWPAINTVAWKPDPEDGAANVAFSTDLSWNPPTDADETWTYNVYIDTDSNPGDTTPYNVSDPIVLNSAFGPLTFGDYWWRVDAIDPSGPTTHTGDVWTFNAGVPLPTLVNPPDGGGSYGLELLLQWDSHDDSVNSGLIQKHRIILNNITDGTTDSTEKLAAQEDYFLGNPDMWDIVFYNKEYTWQVIELGAGDQVLVEGPVWSFNTYYALQCTGFTVWGDLTGDCKVTLLDLAQLGAAWLDCGWQFEGGSVPYPDKDPCNW